MSLCADERTTNYPLTTGAKFRIHDQYAAVAAKSDVRRDDALTTQAAAQAEEARRVRSYLQAQGERYTFAEMWTRLIRARVALMDAAEGVSQTQAEFRPDADEWSIAEVLHHLVTSSGRVADLVEALSRGESANPERIDPPREETTLTIDELRAKLRDDSIAWSALTERLPPAPATTPTAPHSFFGDLHARAWYLFQRVHDLDHAGQIAKNKQAGDYPQ